MNGGLARLAAWCSSHRHVVLFYTLLVTLGASPMLTALRFDADLLQIFLAFSLLVALFDVPAQGWRIALMVVVAVAAGLQVSPASRVGSGLASWATVTVTVVALVAAVSAVRFAMRRGAVTSERIYAGLSAYMLAGVFFGVLHWAIESVWPGSFAAPGEFRLSTAIYFSFVTLATLGYGDVVPKTDVARGLAILEAVAGQLYIAVMIARLVGGRLQASERDTSD